MGQPIDTTQLLALRKLTRAVSSSLQDELNSYLETLTPLFHPRLIFGEHISGVKQSIKGADVWFRKLQENYSKIRKSSVFLNTLEDFNSPMEVFGSSPEIMPVEYTYEATDGDDKKKITVISPFKWQLSYKGQDTGKIKELLDSNSNTLDSNLQACVLHHLVMHYVLARESGVSRILNALRFRVSSEPSAELGGLPVSYITSPISSALPTDDLLIQSTELSGSPVFEEVVQQGDISQLTDPFRERLQVLVEKYGI